MASTRKHGTVLPVISLVLAAGLVGCHGGGQGDTAPTAAPQSTVRAAQAGLHGDLNGSGTPDITDAVGILRIIVGLDPANAIADCDCDGATGITDAIALLRCLVGFDPWPITCGPAPGDQMTGPDGQTLVWVPPGSFMMGSEEGYNHEKPVHQVTLDGFWVGQCEVTNDLYAAFLNEARPADVTGWLRTSHPYCGVEYVEGVYRAKASLGSYPVVLVSWYGAVAYCEHYGYALPTEAQWEYAAAGPDARRYPWGADWDEAKCCNNNNTGPYDMTFPVGSFPDGISWCGALDMAGNVGEWCADWYAWDYYEESPPLNPPGAADGYTRALRGNSYYDSRGADFRCACRKNFVPEEQHDYHGFRCAWNG